MLDEEIKQKFSLRGEPSELSWGKCDYCKKIKDNIRWQHEKGFLLCDECKSFIEKSLREGKDVYMPKYTYWHYYLSIFILLNNFVYIWMQRFFIFNPRPVYKPSEPFTLFLSDLLFQLYHDVYIGTLIVSILTVLFLVFKRKNLYLFYLGALLVFSTYIFTSLRVMAYLSFVSVFGALYLITAIYLIYSYKSSFISLR